MGAVAAAAAATLAAAAVMAPAFAATRPADHAAPARTAAHGKIDHAARRTLADVITSQLRDGGKYVTVVRCTGTASTPPPVRLARLDDPLTVRGTRPPAAVVKLLGPAEDLQDCLHLHGHRQGEGAHARSQEESAASSALAAPGSAAG